MSDYMPNVIGSNVNKPNRFTDDRNSIKYHADYSRYCIYNGFDTRYSSFQLQSSMNRNFWRGNQWILSEDLEAFFMDDSSQARNRIKVIKNFIRPIVEQYRGNAIIMSIIAKAEPVSYKAINRREEMLAELQFFTEVARYSNPSFAGYLRKRKAIGNDADETEMIFENLYTDTYTEIINNIIEYVSKENKMTDMQPDAALDLALTGLVCLKYYIHNGEMCWRRVKPERFYFDRNCINRDTSDAMFWGEYDYLTPSTIFENWQKLTTKQRKAIEGESVREISINNVTSSRNGRIPVYYNYWRDFEEYKFGYVMDEFGYPMCVRIGYIEKGEKEPKYTDKDLIPEKDLTPEQLEILKGKNNALLYFDVVRYCIMIPSEIVSDPEYEKKSSGVSDIILEYGIMPWQDTEFLDISNVSSPYKVSQWVYDDGYTESPVSQLINPQRMINRYASVMEQQVNNAHGKALFYDKSMVDGQDGEAEMLKNIYQGKPVGMNVRGRGIHNAVTEAGSAVDASTTVYTVLEASMRDSMDRIIGVNESLRGESQGADQLVGVTQLQIQRASLIQEPFYYALADVFKQAAQAIANIGKRVYSQNPRKLAIILGDSKANVIKKVADLNLEDFRVFIARDNDHKQQVTIGNNMLLTLYQLQMIDKEKFADLYGRSTTEDIAQALRITANEEKLAAIMQQKQQKVQEAEINKEVAEQQTAQVAEQRRMEGTQLMENEKDRQADVNKTILKLAGNEAGKQRINSVQK